MPCLTSLFPVQLQGRWQPHSEQKLSIALSSWLLNENSLTQHLQSHCDAFRVEVLGQKIMPCSKGEACHVIAEGQQVLVREVLLYCDEQAHVFARTLIPLDSLTGEQQALSELGNQPLGQIIFNNPSLVRASIELSEFSLESTVGQLSYSLNTPATPITLKSLWGRRSLFYIEGKPLLVAEVFLPPALAYT